MMRDSETNAERTKKKDSDPKLPGEKIKYQKINAGETVTGTDIPGNFGD